VCCASPPRYNRNFSDLPRISELLKEYLTQIKEERNMRKKRARRMKEKIERWCVLESTKTTYL